MNVESKCGFCTLKELRIKFGMFAVETLVDTEKKVIEIVVNGEKTGIHFDKILDRCTCYMDEKPLELNVLVSQIDEKIVETTNDLDMATRNYIVARENFTDAKLKYEREFARKIRELKKTDEYRKEQVTFLKEIALDHCWFPYEEMIKAEQLYKEASAMCRAFEQRLMSMKKIKGGDYR